MDAKFLALIAAVLALGSVDFFKGFIGKVVPSRPIPAMQYLKSSMSLQGSSDSTSGSTKIPAAPAFLDVDMGFSLGGKVHISYCNS